MLWWRTVFQAEGMASAKILGHDQGGCAQDLRDRVGVLREGYGGPQSSEASAGGGISLWVHWQSFEGRQLSLAAAWSEQEAGGQVP